MIPFPGSEGLSSQPPLRERLFFRLSPSKHDAPLCLAPEVISSTDDSCLPALGTINKIRPPLLAGEEGVKTSWHSRQPVTDKETNDGKQSRGTTR